MRRGILFLIILAVLVVFAWQVVLKPKSKTSAKTTKKTKTDSTAVTSSKRPKKAGRLKRLTKEEKKAERDRLRAERKRRKQELRRQKREQRLAMKSSRRRSGSKRTKKGLQAYVLQAIVWFDVGPSYAMIDGRRYEVGDEVSGRKILAIRQDQITVDYRGTQSVVRMGESLLPKSYFSTQRRRR